MRMESIKSKHKNNCKHNEKRPLNKTTKKKIVILAIIVAALGTVSCMIIKNANKQEDDYNAIENIPQNSVESVGGNKQNENKETLPNFLEDASISIVYLTGCDISFIYDFLSEYDNLLITTEEMDFETFCETSASTGIEADICFFDNDTYNKSILGEGEEDIGITLNDEITAIIFHEEKGTAVSAAIMTLLQFAY